MRRLPASAFLHSPSLDRDARARAARPGAAPAVADPMLLEY
jgi:hypothetical protein